MLAQNFMAPADLGISNAEFDALTTVLGMLERGEIKKTPAKAQFTSMFGDERNLLFFDMDGTASEYDCGTAGCILGWAWHVNPELPDRGFHGGSIQSLFLPKGAARKCRDPQKAAIALRNYLTSGDPRWEEALA